MSANRANPAGQFLLLEIEDDHWSASLERRLRSLCPGGILLSARSLRTAERTAELLAKIGAALPAPPLLGVGEESREGEPLQPFLPALPTPRTAARKGLKAVARLGELRAAALKLMGFNTVLAPLLDVAPPGGSDEPRTFSPDPQTVAGCGKAFLDGLEHHGILACAKYFPGLGSAKVDRRSSVTHVGKTMAELWREDLIPYRALHARLPLVMIGHGAYKAYDFNAPRPATQSSSVVGGLLRAKLGYKGVAVADDLTSEEIRCTSEPQDAAVKSFVAGCDLLRVNGTQEKITAAIFAALKEDLETGRIPAARMEEASMRLQRLRKQLPRPHPGFARREFDLLAREFEEFAGGFRSKEEEFA